MTQRIAMKLIISFQIPIPEILKGAGL